MKKARSKKKNTGKRGAFHPGELLFLLPSFAGVSIFVLVPFVDVIRRSFLNVVGNRIVFLENYWEVVTNTAFRVAVKNTMIFMGVAIPLLLCVSLLIALALNQMRKGVEVLKAGYLLPMAIPVASVVLILRVLFHRNGFLSSALYQLGFSPQDWLQTDKSMWILIGTYVWRNLGYNIILWMAGLAGIPESVYEAAKMDGASGLKTFWFVTLPNLLTSLYMIAVLAILNSFKVFREAYLIGGDYPDKHMYLIQNIFNNWFSQLALGKMAAGAVLVCIVIMLLILLMNRVWNRED